ncbi:MAG: bifunctional 5,10-methylenetetrahydrofolate dehydrogenase/5,10-methenyltetrahydrofolate cyclohydrolase [Anaerococcus sp.]|nr:bifunctional 5,10-methylenetetrahydrofolate dehydrogenase/5,10-methenyltetrahydrofolate cyclohydrolase [Anaerococcus sp.]
MKILSTDHIKNNLREKLKARDIKGKILLLSKDPSDEVIFYKNIIKKRAKDFDIAYIDHEFTSENQDQILNYINSFPENYGFIILSPFGKEENLSLLRREIRLKDLDSFTYKSLGLSMEGERNGLPATAKAIAIFLEDKFKDLRGLNIVIANNTNIIGKPLASYLSSKDASLTIINKYSKNQREIIKKADIFISAIGRAQYYGKSYFRDGMVLIDVGTSVKDGLVYGDIDYESLKDLDLEVLTNKKGIGAITTLSLLEGLI